MKIALDAMGGDFGPPTLVAGAVMALREYPYITQLFLVGDAAKIEARPDGGLRVTLDRAR